MSINLIHLAGWVFVVDGLDSMMIRPEVVLNGHVPCFAEGFYTGDCLPECRER